MSSYHSSFSYLGKNSATDFKWIISHFSDNADSGETDTFLSTSAVYSDSYDGTRQTFYGAKYDTVATPQITVIKQDGTDFGIEDNRKALRWLTGSKQASWMDFYIGNEIKYRLLGRVKSVSQYKMDARVIGLVITFESVSPYGYSSLQTIPDVVVKGDTTITIPCDSDELYSYVNMNTKYTNTSGNSLTITNNTTGDVTKVTGLVTNEVITISDNMVITSDKPGKTFGNTFNFVFPKLIAGDNELVINGAGNITFQYICPVKLGDIAVDLNAVSDPICNSDGEIQISMLDWNRISNTPTTAAGYGLTDVYTVSAVYNKNEINKQMNSLKDIVDSTASLISDISSELTNNYYDKTEIDERITNFTPADIYTKSEIDTMLESFVSDDVYTKSEINEKLNNIVSSGVDIDEEELNLMLTEILGD